MKIKTTTNIEKGKNWIMNACKNGSNIFFRFVGLDERQALVYSEWFAPYYAWKQVQGANEYNTFRIEATRF